MFKKGFSLLEVLLVLLVLGIFGLLLQKVWFALLQEYRVNTKELHSIQSAQNALLQIKRVLENAHLESLHYDLKPILASINLKNKTLNFYEKPSEFALIGDFALPCLPEIFDVASMQFSSHLTLHFLQAMRVNSSFNACAIYKNPPLFALFVTDVFSAPKDFYNSLFKGRIHMLNAISMRLEIPQIFTLQNPLKIAPKIYYLNTPSMLEFKDSIMLVQNNQNTMLLKNYTAFFISKTPYGIGLKLCIKMRKEHCFEALVTELD